LAAINSDIAKFSHENERIRQRLELKGSEVFVQEASLPQRKMSPKLSLIVLLAVMASGFALLIFVFVRKAWASAARDSASASKVASIKRSLGLQKV
jgi:cytoskeletal protein RodZ